MRMAPDPVLIFVTLSWTRFITLSRTSDAIQMSLLVCLSLLSGIYVSAGIQTHSLLHDPEAPIWTKHMDQTSASGLYDENDQYNKRIPCVIIFFVRV